MTSNRALKGTCCCVKLRSVKVQGMSGPGLVQVWIRLDLKFNSLELDSEVGRLICIFVCNHQSREQTDAQSLKKVQDALKRL